MDKREETRERGEGRGETERGDGRRESGWRGERGERREEPGATE
jgi:hypothetical protein